MVGEEKAGEVLAAHGALAGRAVGDEVMVGGKVDPIAEAGTEASPLDELGGRPNPNALGHPEGLLAARVGAGGLTKYVLCFERCQAAELRRQDVEMRPALL